MYSNDAKALLTEKEPSGDKVQTTIEIVNIPQDRNEMFAHICYEGDVAKMYTNGKMIADNFYTGQEWEVGLKRFISKADTFKCDIEITPLSEGTKLYLQEWPEMINGKAGKISGVELIAQYCTKI